MFLKTGNYNIGKCPVCGGDMAYVNGEWVHFVWTVTSSEGESKSVSNFCNAYTFNSIQKI